MRSTPAFAANLILAAAMVLFVMNSYPMMQAGFDMWWHMAMTEAPQLADPSAFPTARILWHHFWHQTLASLGVTDFFSRALFVHRSQYLATVVLLTTSAYLSLRAVLHRTSIDNQLLLTASLLACVIWLLMTGTASSPRESTDGHLVVQSWIQWYSLNYQISLPLYFGATAATLYALSVPNRTGTRLLWVAIATVLIGIGTLAHAAETAYFLVCLCFMGCFFLNKKNAAKLALVLLLASTAIAWVALDQSYATPELLVQLASLDFSTLFQTIADLGNAMVERDLSRNGTGWNALHSIGLTAMVLLFIKELAARRLDRLGGGLDLRSLGFLVATSSLPLALWFTHSAGLLAMVTHMYIAWRFTFASFLFIGIPLLVVCISQMFPSHTTLRRQCLATALVVISVTCALLYSHRFEPLQPSYRFGQSLIESQNPERSHFGWQRDQRATLQALAKSLRSNKNGRPICVDLHTAYFLFFVERVREVALPEDLSYLPGYVRSAEQCDFSGAEKARLQK